MSTGSMVLVLFLLFPAPNQQVSSAHTLKLLVSSEEIPSVEFAQHVKWGRFRTEEIGLEL